MLRHIVIADAGPLIALARIDALLLLKGLFEPVCITRTVHDEILSPSGSFDDASALTQALNDGWIRVVQTDWVGWRLLNPGVDAGEASSTHVACRWQEAGDAVLLVIDDRAGRAEARSRRLALIDAVLTEIGER